MKRVYMNIDINSITVPFLNNAAKQESVTRDMLYPLVDIYRETEVTDLLFNIFAQSSFPETEYWDSYSDIYERRFENGKEVDYTEYLYGPHRIIRELGIDVFDVWIKRARENGHRAWISLRMNDAHCFKLDTVWIRSRYYYDAKARGLTIGEDYGYYKGCYDYGYEEIREKMLGYIKEQLSKYDVDGLELDFSREIQLFKYLTADMDECRKIMTEFVRRVKKTVTECEKIHGHKIKLAIKCMRDFVNNSFYGLDVLEIAKEGLIDLVIPGPRFRSSETGIPLDEWRAAMPGVEVVPTIESALGVVNEKFRAMTREVVKGVVLNYLTYEPDGIYYFNYFVSPHAYTEEYTGVAVGEDTTWPSMRNYNIITTPLKYEAFHRSAVRFVLIPQSTEGYAKVAPVWQPIPTPVTAEGKSFELRTGPIPDGKKLSLILGFKNYTGGAKVTVNGYECRDFVKTSLDFIEGIGYQKAGYTEPDTVCYKCSLDGVPMDELIQKIKISSDSEAEILTWVEINCY